jgi:hypothetical protein
MQLSEYERKSLQKLGESILEGKWSNEGLVQLIELAGDYLNLQPLSDYAEKQNISYQAAKKNYNGRINIKLFNTKFIIDND